MYSGMPRTNECFPVYTVGGRIGPDEPVSSSNSTFFSLSLLPPSPSPFHQFLSPLPTTNESDPTRIPSRFIDDETRSIASSSSFVDRFTPWNLIHCSFRNATNAMARGTASLYMLFSTFLRTVWVGRMYKLLSSKISPRYVLRELHLAKKRGRDSGHADFFIPNFLIYLLLPSFLPPIHRSSPPPPSMTRPYSISFFALPPSIPFFRPLPFSSIVPNPPSYSFPLLIPLSHAPSIHRTSFSPPLLLPSSFHLPFHFYFRFFHNFASIRYMLTGQWVSGKHLPLVSSSILFTIRLRHRICRGVHTFLTSKPGPFLFFHFYAFSPPPQAILTTI